MQIWKRYNLFFVLSFAALCMHGQAPSVSSLVRWESPLTMDVGTLSVDSFRTATFSFVNTSAFPLRIDNIRTSCGCTAAEWHSAPILPSFRGEIRLTVEGTQQGSFMQIAKVYFRGQRKAERLYVMGFVAAKPLQSP